MNTAADKLAAALQSLRDFQHSALTGTAHQENLDHYDKLATAALDEYKARKDDPLTVAYMAMGAANALRERRAQFDPEQWDGENGFIAAVIEHAPMLDNLVPDDGLVAVFCYDVAEPFGYRYATAMLDGQTLDPRELGNALIAAASE